MTQTRITSNVNYAGLRARPAGAPYGSALGNAFRSQMPEQQGPFQSGWGGQSPGGYQQGPFQSGWGGRPEFATDQQLESYRDQPVGRGALSQALDQGYQGFRPAPVKQKTDDEIYRDEMAAWTAKQYRDQNERKHKEAVRNELARQRADEDLAEFKYSLWWQSLKDRGHDVSKLKAPRVYKSFHAA